MQSGDCVTNWECSYDPLPHISAAAEERGDPAGATEAPEEDQALQRQAGEAEPGVCEGVAAEVEGEAVRDENTRLYRHGTGHPSSRR